MLRKLGSIASDIVLSILVLTKRSNVVITVAVRYEVLDGSYGDTPQIADVPIDSVFRGIKSIVYEISDMLMTYEENDSVRLLDTVALSMLDTVTDDDISPPLLVRLAWLPMSLMLRHYTLVYEDESE